MAIRSRLGRFAAYALIGWAYEVGYSAVHDMVRGRPLRLRTSPWMLPVYGLVQPLFEPAHDGMRGRVPAPLRAAVYGGGFLAVEYASGRALRRLLGRAPWDYSYARWHVDGLIRPDYFFLWAAVGLGAEWVHDRLTGR